MMGIWLKPCPFCGEPSNIGTEKIWIIPDDSWWTVYAVCCDVKGPCRETKEDAAKAWNERYVDKDL